MTLSRRQFNQWVAAAAGACACTRRGFGLTESGLKLGLNTWSLRALSQDEAIPVILRVMKQTGLQECELLFSHVEPARLSPVFPTGLLGASRVPPTAQQLEEQKKTAAALTAWRLSVPLSYFEGIRTSFRKEGLRIKSYATPFPETEAGIDRLFLTSRALGVDSINARIPETLTSVAAAAAEKHRMTVGLQFSDIVVLERQLAVSQWFRIDADIGDLTKAKVNALQFVKDHFASVSSLDLKDALWGGISVPFGEGDAHMKEVLRFLQEKGVALTTYIDCDYAGTGRSTEEVVKCVSYARSVVG